MPLKPKFTARHSAQQLAEEARKATDAGHRDRIRFIQFMVEGDSLAEAVRRIGWSSRSSAQKVRGRYDQGGLEALRPRPRKRPPNSGVAPLLNEFQQAQLHALLKGPAPDEGIWTGPKVARWLSLKVGRTVPPQTGWTYLRKLGFVLRRPRPKHRKAADPTAQAVFKKAQPAPARGLLGEHAAGGTVGHGRAPAGAEADPAAGLV